MLAGLLPASAKRQEERNEIVGELALPIGRREASICGGDALGVEHDLERLAPGLVAQPGDPRRLGALRAGAAQGGQAVELARIAGQRAFASPPARAARCRRNWPAPLPRTLRPAQSRARPTARLGKVQEMSGPRLKRKPSPETSPPSERRRAAERAAERDRADTGWRRRRRPARWRRRARARRGGCRGGGRAARRRRRPGSAGRAPAAFRRRRPRAGNSAGGRPVSTERRNKAVARCASSVGIAARICSSSAPA